MKRTPQTAEAYAKYLYQAARCDGRISQLSDHAIIDSRVRAFVDGVNWQKRRARQKSR